MTEKAGLLPTFYNDSTGFVMVSGTGDGSVRNLKKRENLPASNTGSLKTPRE
jgi:hypothetical protein